jgi:hypothetical protein
VDDAGGIVAARQPFVEGRFHAGWEKPEHQFCNVRRLT